MGQNYQNILVPVLTFPSISLFAWFTRIGNVYIESHENYQKKSFRNKYQIGSHQGPQCLSIPLTKGKNHQMPIRDVRICHSTNWAQQHWKAIQTNYGKSAYFSFYEEHIHEILFRNYTFLYDFNFESLQLLKQLLSLGFSLEANDKYVKYTEENVLDLRHSVGIHMRPNMVFPEYYQVFQSQGFLPDLSILDALFHLGPETRTYLMQCT